MISLSEGNIKLGYYLGIFRSRAPELFFSFACHAKETKDHRCESKTKIDSASRGK